LRQDFGIRLVEAHMYGSSARPSSWSSRLLIIRWKPAIQFATIIIATPASGAR
jgi:hypothetical protein